VTLSIPDFSAASVVVAGDVMLDRYLFGGTERISPEAPVPVVRAALGVDTTLIGVTGKDEEAAALKAVLEQQQINCRFEAVKNWPTTTKTRVQSRGQQLIRLDREEQGLSGSDALPGFLQKALKSASAVVLSDYGKGALGNVSAMIDQCQKANIPVLVDPKGSEFDKYRGATVLTPNQSEFESVVGICESADELVARARTMIADLELGALLVTRSEKGMLLVEASDEPVFLSTRAREVFDVTGAGDTVIAVLAGALASGESLAAAAALSNFAAGLVVRKIGVASVSPSEIRAALHQRGQGGRGLVSEVDLAAMVSEAKLQDESIVMTNGCFDFLHAGHVAYLEEAKSLGDRLIVAVNDDESVRRLKGDGRPVNALQDRMAVLAGLAAVDWVVPFSEDTPARLIQMMLPDVLVKGGDYRPDEIAGAKDVLKNGGEVRVLAFREGHSSSNIIDKLRS
jgi:D-beta-D-heptose 7-phosphate kinase/D-beta-D-heptose 1-phosphate adenosyltransferase